MGDVVLISSESSNDESLFNADFTSEPTTFNSNSAAITTCRNSGCKEAGTNLSLSFADSVAKLASTNYKDTYVLSSDSASNSEDDSASIALKKGIVDSTSIIDSVRCSQSTSQKEHSTAETSSSGLCFTEDAPLPNVLSERFVHVLSDSEDDFDYKNSVKADVNNRLGQFSSQLICSPNSSSSYSEDDIFVPSLHSKEDDNCNKISGKSKNTYKESNLSKKELEVKRRKLAQIEKERKKQELAEAKALKQAAAKMQKVYKPEECLNYMTALLDHNLFVENFGGDLKNSLQELDVKYQTHSQIYPMTITWIRKIPVDGNATKTIEESHVLLVMTTDCTVDLVLKHGMCNEVQAAQAHYPSQKLSLILHGTENYFRPHKKGKSKDAPRITRDDLTEALVEVHILAGCNHRFAESSMEVAMMIAQYSKSIAEIPYRLEKGKKEENKLDWFGEGDNRDCVRVDKNGVGLKRLWGQQLCEFNLAGLQISEAITAVYQTPQALFQAYEACSSQNDAEKLLQDIPIRRNVGALSSARRIGPELSKKVHAFFTSLDGTSDVSIPLD